MVIFFTLTLAVSLLGMISLVVLKRFELATGHILGASMRPRVGNFFHTILVWVEQVAPSAVRTLVSRTYTRGRLIVQRLLAWGIVKVEHGLEHTLTTLRHGTATRPSEGQQGQGSEFLREVAEHKKQLLRRSKASRAIYEE